MGKMSVTPFRWAGASMVFWFSLSLGLVLGTGFVGAVVAMRRAEQRARRAFYWTLGYGDDLTAPLLPKNRPISYHLAMIRESAIVTPPVLEERRDRAAGERGALRRAARYTRALNGTRTSHERSEMAARRNPLLGRQDLS